MLEGDYNLDITFLIMLVLDLVGTVSHIFNSLLNVNLDHFSGDFTFFIFLGFFYLMVDFNLALIIATLSVIALEVSCLDNKHGLNTSLVLFEESWSKGKGGCWSGIVVVFEVYMGQGLISVDLLNPNLYYLWRSVVLKAWGLALDLSGRYISGEDIQEVSSDLKVDLIGSVRNEALSGDMAHCASGVGSKYRVDTVDSIAGSCDLRDADLVDIVHVLVAPPSED